MLQTGTSEQVSATAGVLQDSLLASVREAFVLIDPLENCIVDANAAASELLGFSHAELCASKVTSIFHFVLPALITFTESVLARGHGWTNELLCGHRDGRTVGVEVSAARHQHHGTALIIMQLRDKQNIQQLQEAAAASEYVRRGIVEWKRIERIFQDIERENQLLLSAVGEGIYGVNADGKTTFVNPAAERMLGWSADELVGKDAHGMIHYHHRDGSDYHSHECLIYAAFHDGAIHRVDDEVFWRKNGVPIEVEYTSTPIRDRGRLVGAVVVFRDVSERKQAEKKLHAALHEVEELKRRLEMENAYLLEEIRAEHNYKEIVGKSKAIQHIINQIELVAPTDANVLITGESGTGKELIARAIHESSERHERPLIRVNCAAIPRELFESEFFGHIKGAFTGAVSDRTGRFDLADGGTLFLDEVGEIPLELQGKLLRVLQEGQFERVGDNQTRKVDVRIIAATNRNLLDEVRNQSFRQDLYFRLNVFPIESVALRERREDIPLLANHFLQLSRQKLNKPSVRLSRADMERLNQYHWPGNIRELQNVIESAVILSRNGRMVFQLPRHAFDVNETIMEERVIEPADVKTRQELQKEERENIVSALKQTGGKVFGKDGAAALLQMRPTTLASKIKRMRIDRAGIKVKSIGG
ncbi:MAG: sigma 54-interacting transcriptional regulator [Pseudomonadota bacterium]|nr:sigma 54-interacting transcriptional regulator [Pseudomonadota bacterium]